MKILNKSFNLNITSLNTFKYEINLQIVINFLLVLVISCREPVDVYPIMNRSDVWSKLNDSTFIAVYKDDTIMAAVYDHEIFFGQWKNNTYYTFTVNAASGGMDFQASGKRAVGFLSNPEARAAIRIQEGWYNGENYIGIKSPEIINDNITFTLPDSYGKKGQVLSTAGNGTLLWTSKKIAAISSNGDYSPDFISITNIEYVKTIAPFQYIRVGATISVSGEIAISPIDTATPT